MDIVSDELIVKSLAILVDVSDFPLVEDQRVLLAPDYCKIDHHHESNPFLYDKIMDHGVIATAELIARIAFQETSSSAKGPPKLSFWASSPIPGAFFMPRLARRHLILSAVFLIMVWR